MLGLLNIANFKGGEADLTKEIAKLGYDDTPLFNMIAKAVPSVKGQTYDGHSWRYEEAPEGDETNINLEGSAAKAPEFVELGTSKNHYQIVKHSYGITGSMEDRQRSDGEEELVRQGTLATIRHRKTIEKALFKNVAPVQRGAAAEGVMGGIKHWCTAQNSTLGVNADLSMQIIKELLKISHFKGNRMTHAFMSDTQKDRLDALLDSKVMTGLGAKVLEGTNYMQISNLAYAPNLKIILTPYVNDDEIVFTNMSNLALVYQRLTKKYDLARTKDAVEKELISELTLRVNNPYAVGLISGLTTN